MEKTATKDRAIDNPSHVNERLLNFRVRKVVYRKTRRESAYPFYLTFNTKQQIRAAQREREQKSQRFKLEAETITYKKRYKKK